MPIFGAWQLSDLNVSGPDPFAYNASANAYAPGNSSFTIAPTAKMQMIDLDDDDAFLSDGDGDQELRAAITFDGVGYGTGSAGDVQTEYSYIIRPSGADDTSETITLHVLKFEGDVHGIASTARLLPGQSYDIVAIESHYPSLAYSSMAVCFARGTRIATKQGPVAVEDLRPGMRVQTADNGYRALLWTGRWRMHGRAENAPVHIAQGALGNDRALEVSAQHRMVVRPTQGGLRGQELLLPAKALVGLPGITRPPRPRIEWLHLLFERHEIVFAEGARAESLLPGPQALRGIAPDQAAELRSLSAQNPFTTLPARAILPPGQARRLSRRRGGLARFLHG